MSKINTLTQTQLNRIQSQLGLSDRFTVLGINKEVQSICGQPQYKASCELPEDYYLITVEDQKKGFKNGFVRLVNITRK